MYVLGILALCDMRCKYLFSVCHLSFTLPMVVFAMQSFKKKKNVCRVKSFDCFFRLLGFLFFLERSSLYDIYIF